jgi:hypothetical protein
MDRLEGLMKSTVDEIRQEIDRLALAKFVKETS